jgi:N-acetylneuraminate synthase
MAQQLLQNTPFIIAEIGINHNGDVGVAKQLIDMAKTTGCDAVKFQKRTVDTVYSLDYLNAPKESPWGNTQHALKDGLEFGQAEYEIIDQYCKQKNIAWFISAWDVASQLFVRQYDVKYNKIASPMLTHEKLLKTVAKEKKLTFIATGMSTFDEIDKAVAIFRQYDCPFVLMHAVSLYPCKDEDCNLSLIKVLAEKYQCPVGYSGHEVGVLPSVTAVALGAVAVERHVTLNRAMYGSDQAASLEEKGLELVVRDSKRLKGVIGDGQKRISEAELERRGRYKMS